MTADDLLPEKPKNARRRITDAEAVTLCVAQAIGKDVAIDASDIPAYANGQRFTSKGDRGRSDDEFSDPDASWGHRPAVSTCEGGGF